MNPVLLQQTCVVKRKLAHSEHSELYIAQGGKRVHEAAMRIHLKRALKMARMSQNQLAAKLPASKGYISQVASGQRIPSMEMLNRIATVLDVPLFELVSDWTEPTAQPPLLEFGEPDVVPITQSSNADKVNALRILSASAKHAATYRLTRPMPQFALLENDLLIVDLNSRKKVGDLVLATIADPSDGSSATLLRRWLEPWLVDGTPDGLPTKVADDDQTVAILGTVTASYRGIKKFS